MSALVERLRFRVGRRETRRDCMPQFGPPSLPPRASLATWARAESALGFALPPLLRELYTSIANGGFGPGYGLIGVGDDGALDDGKSIVDKYRLFRTVSPEHPTWCWPERVILLCTWGCAIYSGIDCSREEAPVLLWDPNDDSRVEDNLRPQRPSLESWLSAWADGVDLWKEMYPD
jgi:hypothetical protein